MNKFSKVIGLISWLMFSLLVIFVAVYLLLIANGYKINYKNRSIQKTGMIYIESQVEDVKIYINEILESEKSPFKKGDLDTGRYDIRVSSDGYQSWLKTAFVSQGQTEAYDNIILFLINPVPIDVGENEKSSLTLMVEDWPPKGLEIKNDSEVWFNDVFITRFSKSVKQLSWHTDLKHIFVQVADTIVIMEPDGTNVTNLVKLGSDQPSKFIVLNNGQELLYQDGEQVKKVRIIWQRLFIGCRK